MQFRLRGQRDDRRRRVLGDARLGGLSVAPAIACLSDERPIRKSENYGDALFMDEQLRLTDLVPRRLPVLALVFLAGVAIIAGLEALYAWMPRLASAAADGRVTAFDLESAGSLGTWFSSMILMLAAGGALIVYSVRRHKTDDYSGYYRVWLWAALCWLAMSIDESASLHEGFKEMMTMLTGTRLVGDGSMWWVLAYFFVLGPVGTRLLVDMRCCWLSTATLLAVGVSYAVAIAARLGWMTPDLGPREVMLEEGAAMTGNLLLVMAMLLHARHVLFDAEGLLPVRASRDAAEEADDPWKDEDGIDPQREAALLAKAQSIRIHPPHTLAAPSYAGSGMGATYASPAQAEASMGRKLTRQEKKALRRRLEKMRHEREKRCG